GVGMNHSRHYFFARAALAAHQHGDVGIGHLLDGGFYFFHLWAGTEEHGKIALPPHLLAQLSDFAHEPQPIHYFVDPQVEIFGLERLAHVIIGAQLGGAEDDLRVALGGEHDDGGIRFDLLNALQRLNAVDAV